MKQKTTWKQGLGMLFLAVGLILLGNSIRMSFCGDIWYDELFTMGLIQHSYGELTAFTAQDVHPPLYYYIVKMVIELCKLIMPAANTVTAAKIVSVIPYFLLFFYAVFYLRKRFGLFSAGLFFFCILAMPKMSAYTVEIRMYSWALFFVTAAYFHAYELIQGIRSKRWYLHGAAFVCYGLAASYTQYFACVAVIMLYLGLFLWFLTYGKKKNEANVLDGAKEPKGSMWRIRAWFIGVSISALAYLPWLFVLSRQMSAIRENYWILPLTWRSLGGCVKYIFLPAFTGGPSGVLLAVLFFCIYGVLFLYLLIRAFKRGDLLSVYATLGAFVLAGLVLFGFAVSYLFRPIFVYRYMMPALGCFWFSFVLGLDQVGGKGAETKKGTKIRKSIEIRKAAEIIGMMICVLVLITGFGNYRAFLGEEQYKAVLMEETEAALSGLDEEDILIFNFDQVQMVTGYYLNNDSYLWYGQPEELVQEICGKKKSLNEDIVQIREWLSAGKQVWFLGSFNSREDILALWQEEGIANEEQGSYLLERYWFNLYALALEDEL